MGDRKHKGVVTAKHTGLVVRSRPPRLHFTARLQLLCLILIVVAAGSAWIVLAQRRAVHNRHVAVQHKLQHDISDVNSQGNIQKLKVDSDSLIQGVATGAYSMSNKDLAQAYIARGDAELNSGDYKAAIADYAKVVQLDSSQKRLVAYGEFLARYHLGERRTLVPLLESLEAPLKNSHETGAPEQLALYEGYVTDLQAGKDLEL